MAYIEGEQEIYQNSKNNLDNNFKALLIDIINNINKVKAKNKY